MSGLKPRHHFRTRAFCLVILTWLCSFACTPIVVQLDESWLSQEKKTSFVENNKEAYESPSTERGSPDLRDAEANTEPKAERAPEPTPEPIPEQPSQCQATTNETLRISPPLNKDQSSLLIASLGSQAAGQMFFIRGPESWLIIPQQVRANRKGELAFLLNTQKARLNNTEEVVVYNSQSCVKQKIVSAVNSQHIRFGETSTLQCLVNSNATLRLALKGKPKLPNVSFSSDPERVEVLSNQTIEQPGKPEIVIQIRCKKKGQVPLLVGGQDTEAVAMIVEVVE